MGWNSWDSFGTTVSEVDVRANAEWIAQNLKSYGWQYVVVDMEWFVSNPTAEGNSTTSKYILDQYGRYLPDPGRFPSALNGAGFKPLADYIHSLGLKFGIHILRGIPKEAVARNLPIAGSSYRAGDAAVSSDTCPWNHDNYGVEASKPAAQAYYDSVAQLYAAWGVDFVKADCIASRPYKGDEIRMLSEALRKTGREIVLSLSPGEAPIEKIDELRVSSEMWRISDDVWDLWHSEVSYPQGLGDQLPRLAKWAGLGQPGRWPDADMLPLGYLGPAPGWGSKSRPTRLTHDEQRMLMTLWCMFRSPLMMGGNLPQSDAWTKDLLTNAEVLAVDQHSTRNRQALETTNLVVWVAQAQKQSAAKIESAEHFYVAACNRSERRQTAQYQWKDLGLAPANYKLRNLWDKQDSGQAASMSVELAPHSCVLYQLDPP
jgi:hypothetical protein